MRGIKNLWILLVLLLAISFQGAAEPSYIFHHLTTDNGLSNSNVQAILRDSLGFLWIGTESGLDRYDGYGFKVYGRRPDLPNSPISLSNDNVNGLWEDGLGNIWVSSSYSWLFRSDHATLFGQIVPL